MYFLFFYIYVHRNELIIKYILRKKIIGNNFLINYSINLLKTTFFRLKNY